MSSSTLFFSETQGFPPIPEGTILSQYANSPTILQLISNMGIYFNPYAALQSWYDLIWNLNTAVGYGLDVWGRIVGISRVLQVANQTAYVGFTGTVITSASGFPLGDHEDQAIFWTGVASGTTSFALTDEAYRTMIRAKALFNISDASASSVNRILNLLFGPEGVSPVPGTVWLADGLNMTVRYVFSVAPTLLQLAILNAGVVPKAPTVAVPHTAIIPIPVGVSVQPILITAGP